MSSGGGRWPVVAIDGPAGAGKSTVARRAADLLGFHFLDTGATYRAATWNALQKGIDLTDGPALAAATRSMDVRLCGDAGQPAVTVDGVDVTEAIRSPAVTQQIFRLADNPEVREHLVALQRHLADGRPTVAEGRDMGTVVFPDAACKVFLVASVAERVRRRTAELATKGLAVDPVRVRQEIEERDRRDASRPVGALRQAPDAVVLDTSDMTPEEAAAAIAESAREVYDLV